MLGRSKRLLQTSSEHEFCHATYPTLSHTAKATMTSLTKYVPFKVPSLGLPPFLAWTTLHLSTAIRPVTYGGMLVSCGLSLLVCL